MSKTMKITYTAIFAALATVLMYFEFYIPFMPPFLKVDISGAIILIGAFTFGIKPAIVMILIKDLIHAMQTQTMGTGELQDFILLAILVIVSVSIYNRIRTQNGAIIGCVVGSVVMSIAGMATNYLFILPFYSKAMGWPLESIWEMCQAVNPHINGMASYLLFAILPFNLIKCSIITCITMLIYKKLSMFIKSKHEVAHKNETV